MSNILYVLYYRGKMISPGIERVAAYRSHSLADHAMSVRAGKKAFDRWQEGRYGDYQDLYNEEVEKFTIKTFILGGDDDID